MKHLEHLKGFKKYFPLVFLPGIDAFEHTLQQTSSAQLIHSQREAYCRRTTEFGLYEADRHKTFFDSFVIEKVRKKKTLKIFPVIKIHYKNKFS